MSFTSAEDPYHVSRHAESKITQKMTLVAQTHCKDLIDAFNDCARGRNISMTWACKGAYNLSQDCFHLYVNEQTVAEVKKRWVELDRPRHPDWTQLLNGLNLPPAERQKNPNTL